MHCILLQQYQDAVQAEGDQDLSRLHRMGVSLENQTSDESEDDCDPSVTDSPVGMFCQIFADVDESKDDLDLSERPDLSTLQVLSHVEQKTTDYQEESSDDGGEDIQYDKDRTDNETMEKRPSKERPVHPRTLAERGQGKVRVYPDVQNIELRCQSQTLELVTRAVETGKPSLGVKGPSVLSLLPGTGKPMNG
ncbi:hypothetical protein MHYP_G00131010 [Metynnis hypsauchen]